MRYLFIIVGLLLSAALALSAIALYVPTAPLPDTSAVAPCSYFPNNVPANTRMDVCIMPNGDFQNVR